MESIDLQALKEVQAIIIRDSKDATYKFALLRGAIEICQEFDHLKQQELDGKVTFPFGLLIEKWIMYYYPLLESKVFIPQKNGETEAMESGKTMAFRRQFQKVIGYYNNLGGFAAFYSDYHRGAIPGTLSQGFLELVRKIRDTIANMPMKYLGFSVNKVHYSVFMPPERANPIRHQEDMVLDREFLVKHMGRFSISAKYYPVFWYLGSFITGSHSLLTEWAAFSSQADKTARIRKEDVLSRLITFPEDSRRMREVRDFYQSLSKIEEIHCVWSGKLLQPGRNMHIDHVIPFSLWGNNDLWNLMPAHDAINLQKSDKVPSYELLLSAKTRVINYWEKLKQKFDERFFKEIQLSLAGYEGRTEGSLESAFEKLCWRCKFLEENRGVDIYRIS